MPSRHRVSRAALAAAAAALAVPGTQARAQDNPYVVASEAWGALPDGRDWGATSAVHPGPDGRTIWVAERCGGNSCIGKPDMQVIFQFDLDGKRMRAFGAGLFAWPHGMHVDREGNVWVTDAVGFGQQPEGLGHVVYEFSPDGRLLLTLGKPGVAGSGPDTFTQPSDVLVAPNGDIFVADGHGAGGNNRIVKFSKDGRFLKEWGTTGTGPGQFRDPHGLAMDSQGRLFVADRANNRIQIFDQDGNHIASWTQFGRPSGVFIDADDVLYVADSESNTRRNPGVRRGIYIGSARDGTVTAFIPDPEPDPDNSATSGAEGVAADALGNIYGAEVGPRTLRKYTRAQTRAAQSMGFFITSRGPGDGANLGGLAGADAHCAALAEAAGVVGREWRAYLSTTATDEQPAVNARDRIGSGPWYNARGVLIARDVTDLHSENANLNKQASLNERGEMVNGRGDRPNRHDILTGSQLDGTAFPPGEDTTCSNWTSNGEGSAQLGHHDRTGGGANPNSWNSAHGSRGCSQENLQGTGGDGLFYCFAADAPSHGTSAAQTAGAGSPSGEWRYWGADAASTRYSPLDQINAQNFASLEVAWVWRGDNFGPTVDNILRATPIYANGRLFSVAGARRTAVAIDPATGETLWTFREPPTKRWMDSMRKNYGKGVAYAEVDGRGVVYLVTPAFFLHALDAQTGRPVQAFGDNGTVDLLADLGYPYHPTEGLPPEVGYITNSSPPIVVNGVVVVGNAHEQGYYQTRKENVPGHILAYDARTGDHLWKFNVIPRPGEFGHDTWEDDAWRYTGNVSAWAPLSADLERGIVYIPTDPPTNDYYGGHRPGAGLFGTSLLALDAKTGRRIWHFQMVHHDLWNYDNPHAPQLVDITVDGRRIPAVVQTTKQSFAYVFDRTTGEPVWPIVERPVPQSDVPGEQTSPTQPFPTRPAPYEMQGITIDDLIDFTPELRAKAVEHVKQYRLGPLFNPPAGPGAKDGVRASVHCPGANGGSNIPGGSVVDPETGILYVASIKGCSAPVLLAGKSRDDDATMDWVTNGPGGIGGVDGLPLLKPPYGRITAIDLNTGEHLWWIPNGDTPERVRNHPALQGLDIPPTGKRAHATAIVTKTLLMFGEGRGAAPLFHAVDKRTGEHIASVELPAPTNTAPMTYMHEGKQYIVVAIGSGRHPGSLVALRLP